ncbi:hypothetical protein HDU85_007470 [Gaertneriomyces sp. JEL0708]|nr:hypothetical protein HDU85_007470 [Gaertneriomyces sp. JEL0708]
MSSTRLLNISLAIIHKAYRWLIRHRFAALLLTILPTIFLIPLVLSASGSLALIPRDLLVSKRPLLVVAHPDDECLFFSPSILGLTRGGASLQSESSKGVHRQAAVLVLSAGNNYGLGEVRKRELLGSCEMLGVSEERCVVLDVPEIQDNPRQWWPSDKVAEIIHEHVKKFNADAIITFDEGGVSGHLNHRSVHRSVEQLAKTFPSFPPSFSSTTVFLLRKYSSIFDLALTSLPFMPNLVLGIEATDRALFLASWNEYRFARLAFWSHRSQMSWDRHLYMVASRYMMMNDLRRIK